MDASIVAREGYARKSQGRGGQGRAAKAGRVRAGFSLHVDKLVMGAWAHGAGRDSQLGASAVTISCCDEHGEEEAAARLRLDRVWWTRLRSFWGRPHTRPPACDCFPLLKQRLMLKRIIISRIRSRPIAEQRRSRLRSDHRPPAACASPHIMWKRHH